MSRHKSFNRQVELPRTRSCFIDASPRPRVRCAASLVEIRPTPIVAPTGSIRSQQERSATQNPLNGRESLLPPPWPHATSTIFNADASIGVQRYNHRTPDVHTEPLAACDFVEMLDVAARTIVPSPTTVTNVVGVPPSSMHLDRLRLVARLAVEQATNTRSHSSNGSASVRFSHAPVTLGEDRHHHAVSVLACSLTPAHVGPGSSRPVRSLCQPPDLRKLNRGALSYDHRGVPPYASRRDGPLRRACLGRV